MHREQCVSKTTSREKSLAICLGWASSCKQGYDLRYHGCYHGPTEVKMVSVSSDDCHLQATREELLRNLRELLEATHI